ncbi:MAG: transketolase [Pseudomonadota bacterium]|nr:transketolase [Pseudomonadota bacterium]
MRNSFCQAMLARAAQTPQLFFLTGDLGFMALEPLRDALGERFVNVGVSEQSMIALAAGIRRNGGESWAYSIAPFCYARPFEQIRNDVCLNGLPVRLVGNGGGYAYGPMGGTHHAIEDYGVLLTLSGLRVYVPAFGADVAPMVAAMGAREEPGYLRLGRSEVSDESALPAYQRWRCLLEGAAGLVVVAGPLAGKLWNAWQARDRADRPALWVLGDWSADDQELPAALCQAIAAAPALAVVEEHVAQGGLAAWLLYRLALAGVACPPLHHACARGYPSGRYGSQAFHRRECGLEADTILEALRAAAGLPASALAGPAAQSVAV